MSTPFKDHFSGHASAYADARPGYPPQLFAWLSAQCRSHAQAWDAGCGNGQASVALAAHFAAVHASDPSAAQIASATAHPRVRYAVEPAEHCSLASDSADLVTVAQAYHWFDHARFCAEASRVLKPGGVIALWSYAESRVSVEVDAVFDELHDRRLEADWPAGREHVINRYRDLPFPFAPLAAPAFEMRCRWELSQYLDYLRSWSASQRYLERTGRDAVAEIAPAMSAAWGDPQAARVVQWPLTLLAGRRD
ncbi:MAG: class I SAM-dependent methyltransferase [Arenimonas sp.]